MTQHLTTRRRPPASPDARRRATDILDNLPERFYSVDRAWRLSYVNAAVEAYLGRSRAELLGRILWDVIPPVVRTAVEAACREALETGTVLDPVGPVALGDRWVEAAAYPTTSGMTLHVRDVTDRVRAEHAAQESAERLRISEERFAGIVSLSAEGIVSIDERQRIVLFNQGAEALFGYPEAEVLGQRIEMLLPGDIRSLHERWVRDFAELPGTARTMGERNVDVRGRRRDGTLFHAEASISKQRLRDGWLFTAILRDVTERQRLAEAQRMLAESGLVLASSLDFHETVAACARLVVPAFADWCVAWVRGEAGALELSEVCATDPGLEGELRARAAAGPADPAAPQTWAAGLDGSIHGQVPDTLGTGLSVVLLGRTPGRPPFDALDRTLAEALVHRLALAEENARLFHRERGAVEARDETLRIVSHDLRNPLQTVNLVADVLEITRDEPKRLQYLNVIRHAVEEMDGLIEDLLEVARLEAGGARIEPAPVDVAELLHEVAERHTPLAAESGLELVVLESCEEVQILADRPRILRVFSNLLGNAIKFTPPAGRVTVTGAAAGALVQFTVTDTGSGISPEDLPHVFDRFWQAKTHRRGGAGLGLAIARSIVEAQGGTIDVESTVGEGSHFRFTVPAIEGRGGIPS